MNTLIAKIPRSVSAGEKLVVVKESDFDAFQKWRNETSDALIKINRGRTEYRKKTTIIALSPKRFR